MCAIELKNLGVIKRDKKSLNFTSFCFQRAFLKHTQTHTHTRWHCAGPTKTSPRSPHYKYVSLDHGSSESVSLLRSKWPWLSPEWVAERQRYQPSWPVPRVSVCVCAYADDCSHGNESIPAGRGQGSGRVFQAQTRGLWDVMQSGRRDRSLLSDRRSGWAG